MVKNVLYKREKECASKVLIELIRKVINIEYQINEDIFIGSVWSEIFDIARRQGVLAIILDVISTLPNTIRPDRHTLMLWIGNVVCQEETYKKHSIAIDELSVFFKEHDIKMMLLKGWGLSLNYPQPNHRQTGDIDIWLYGNQEMGDAILAAKKDIHPIKSSHHTIFEYNGVEVENHISFIEVDCHKNDGSEDLILSYAEEPAIEVNSINGNTILLPPPNLNAYFLLRHSSCHFATDHITLRHLLDWGFFVEKYYDYIDWARLYANAELVNMHTFLDCQNAICVNKLGFPKKHFPIHSSHPQLEERIFHDILWPEFTEKAPPMNKKFVKYCYVKTKRHFANKWKYKITYKESFWSILIRFAINRIKSPYSYADIAKLNSKDL